MATATVLSSCETFFSSIRKTSLFALLADYDGTLAPFHVNRDQALPYVGVRELLAELAERGVRVAIVSGRTAQDVKDLLGIDTLEVWGCHGAERLLPTGELVLTEIPQTISLDLLVEVLSREHLASVMEVKPFGVALHWRGLAPREIAEIRFAAARAYRSLPLPNIQLQEFDGGLEFRPRTVTKANAIMCLKDEQPSVPLVYMGDDFTDEDAFRALGMNDLSVLVRPEYRPTSARLWLKPPDQLIALLQFMATAVGGLR
jgi:trehalose-phosphatase